MYNLCEHVWATQQGQGAMAPMRSKAAVVHELLRSSTSAKAKVVVWAQVGAMDYAQLGAEAVAN